MRTYGRTYDENGDPVAWVQVNTDSQGRNDHVYITTLAQVLKLSPGESPFYANYGVPGQQSVMQQILPDYYIALTQSQFAGYFAALTVARLQARPGSNPVYNINVVTHIGVQLEQQVPV